jgi:hypothetical protein
MDAIPRMSRDEVRAWKARWDFVSARMDAEESETPHDPVHNRMIAEALAIDAWMRGWRPRHDPERVAEKLLALKRLHGTAVRAPA